MANNSLALGAAKTNKNDEFYTQLTDIEKELRYYRKHFRGKTVFCNCDDPFESNFFKYFVLNFNRLGLKKLIATCYSTSPIMGHQLRYRMEEDGQMAIAFGDEDSTSWYDDGEKRPYKAVVTTVYDKTGDGGVDMLDVAELFKSGENQLTELEGDGDFRSPECLALLDEADIVVTNPPFSLFRKYVSTLMEKQKHFIIIGNINAITYKEFFPLLKNNQIWIGASIHSGDRKFFVPDNYPLNASGCWIDENGRRFIRVKGVRWYTNLDIRQRHEEMILVKRYSPDTYPKYDNYDAIEVGKTSEIPCDYAGVMGVPVTFMDKYNPDQFEIIGLDRYTVPKQFLVGGRVAINGKPRYARILIRNKHPERPREEQHNGDNRV
ncbi:MAG: adenine-specific methyltransferase EcoRI family protein [Clostridiales bacterium]|nr:adenine-specific methyltransferase EcoRI family protein [Clostridiales bacterium]